jgi:hypothetical protein
MDAQKVDYEGYVLAVHAEQNSLGAWCPRISVLKDGATVAVLDTETTQPEWSTEEEAVRDGVDQGRAFVERRNRETGKAGV